MCLCLSGIDDIGMYMCHVLPQALSPGNIYSSELFFIRRVIAVYDFCHELTGLLYAMRAEPLDRK